MTRSRRETRRQKRAFTQKPGEDNYAFLARGWRQLRFRDLAEIAYLRQNDRGQVEALQLYANLKMVQWTRALTLATVILGACTVIAALIVA